MFAMYVALEVKLVLVLTPTERAHKQIATVKLCMASEVAFL